MTTLIDRLRGNPEQLSGWVLYEAADELERQAKEIEALKAAAQQALTVLRGCLEHPDAGDAISALQHAIAQPAKPEPIGYSTAMTAVLARLDAAEKMVLTAKEIVRSELDSNGQAEAICLAIDESMKGKL